MGATTFHEIANAALSAWDAFTMLAGQARYEYGHGGYTGTIAEKYDLHEFPAGLDDLGAVPVETVIQALNGDENAVAELLAAYPAVKPYLAAAQESYDDKWGPAVGFRHGDEWHFCGWASD